MFYVHPSRGYLSKHLLRCSLTNIILTVASWWSHHGIGLYPLWWCPRFIWGMQTRCTDRPIQPTWAASRLLDATVHTQQHHLLLLLLFSLNADTDIYGCRRLRGSRHWSIMVCNPCTRHCIFHWLTLFNTTDYDRIQSHCNLYIWVWQSQWHCQNACSRPKSTADISSNTDTAILTAASSRLY